MQGEQSSQRVLVSAHPNLLNLFQALFVPRLPPLMIQNVQDWDGIELSSLTNDFRERTSHVFMPITGSVIDSALIARAAHCGCVFGVAIFGRDIDLESERYLTFLRHSFRPEQKYLFRLVISDISQYEVQQYFPAARTIAASAILTDAEAVVAELKTFFRFSQ